MKESDRYLPIANISRAVLDEAKEAPVSHGAVSAIQECCSEFVGIITNESAMRCHFEKRKTITAKDILASLDALGCERYVQGLRRFISQQGVHGRQIRRRHTSREPAGMMHPSYFDLEEAARTAQIPEVVEVETPVGVNPCGLVFDV